MKILLIYSHFNDNSLSHHFYTHAIKHLSDKGHEVKARNLYKIGFNPVFSEKDWEAKQTGGTVSQDVAHEQKYISWADALLFIYPIWWWDRPAILKGWCDRVLTQGFAFDYTTEGPYGLLGEKKAYAIQLLGMPQNYPFALENSYMFQNSFIEGTLGFCGITQSEILTIYNTFYMTPMDGVLTTTQVTHFLNQHF